MTRTVTVPALALLGLLAGACEGVRGVAAVSEALAERYGADAVQVRARDRGEATTVEVTLETGAGPSTDPWSRAREAAAIAVARYPLSAPADSIVVSIVATGERGVLTTRHTATFRFAAGEEAARSAP